MRSYPKNMTADIRYGLKKMRVIGLRETMDLSRESIVNCKGFFTAYVSFSIMQFECFVTLQGTFGGNFDIFAFSGESTAWVLLWNARSRPIGVRVCAVALYNLFSTALVPRAWTMVVFWRNFVRYQPQLITPENQGDNTACQSPHNVTFCDDPEVPFGPVGSQHPAPPEPHRPPGPRGSPGPPPGWLPAPSHSSW